MQEQFETIGSFTTENAGKYLIQLCKHFGHKVPARIDGDRGQVTFQIGEALLTADGSRLTARLIAQDQDAIARLQHIIDDHLKRFAFRETFTGMHWRA